MGLDASPCRDAAINSTATGNLSTHGSVQYNGPVSTTNQYLGDAKSKEDLFLRDLYITNPRVDKERIQNEKGGLLSESYSWILDRAAFRDWRDKPGARVLWIKGSPGTGKTMLLCGIVGELERSMHPQDLLSYFFCEPGDKKEGGAAAVLRGILHSLVCQRPELINSTALKEYKMVGSKLFEGSGAWYALRHIFLGLLSDLSREPGGGGGGGVMYFVIDALDECGKGLEALLSFISEASLAHSGVKWLVACQDRADVTRHLKVDEAAGRQELDLDDDCTKEMTHAVNAYIDRCASELAPDKGDDGWRREIRDGLRQKAWGTFRYVELAVAKLQAVPTHEVLDVMREVALDVEGLYRQASDRIQSLKREKRHLCCSVLATIAIAHRPLNREELYALAGLTSNDNGGGDGGGTAEDVMRKCDPFGIKRVAPFSLDQSAREFLLRDRALFPDGFEHKHRRVFLRSLALMEATLRRDMYGLGHPGFLAVDIVRAPNPNPLAAAAYACEYWIEHLVASNYHGRETEDGGALMAFLEFRYLHWLEGLSLLGAMRTALSSWPKLVDHLRGKQGARLLVNLVVDAQRFLEYNGQCIMARPLQAYASAVVFAPSGTPTGEVVWVEEPKWVAVDAGMREERWGPWAQTLEPSGAGLGVVGPVAISPDGTWLAAALQGDRDDGETVQKVQVWDVVTGKTTWTLDGAGGWMAFHPNHLLGTVTGPDEVKFWDLAKGVWHHCVIRPLQLSATAAAAVFSPNWAQLAAADGGDSIATWDLASGDRVLQFRHHNPAAAACHSLAYSADGTRLASAHQEEIRVWDARSGSLLRSIRAGHITQIAFMPDPAAGRLVSASNKSMMTWSVDTGERLSMLNAPSEHGRYNNNNNNGALTISPDGSRFAATPDRTIVIWDTATTSRLQTIQGYDEDVRSLSISPDGCQIASVGKWGLWLYRATSAGGDMLRAARDHPDKIDAIKVSADGGSTMVSASGSTINVWDLGETARHSCQIQGEGILDVVLSPDGTRLVSLSSSQDVGVWDAKTGHSLQTIEHPAFAASFSPDGETVALLTFDGPIQVWDLAEKMCVRTLEQAAAAARDELHSGSVAFGPDHGLAASSDRTIRVWKLYRDPCIWTIKDDGTARSLVFRSNGSQLAASYSDAIRIWDPAKGCCLRTFDTGGCRINVTAFDAADGSRLQTDAGIILLDDEVPPPATAEDGSVHRRGLRRQGYGVDASSGWVTWGSEKVLWLPPAYRPDSTAVLLPEPGASTPSAIILGCCSGRVVVLRFPTGLAPGLSLSDCLYRPSYLPTFGEKGGFQVTISGPNDPSSSSRGLAVAMDVLKLSVVHQPLNPRAVPCFDIVLVHEFGGHTERTLQPLWPAEDESGWLPDARVLSFGYNETSWHSYGREVLSGLAERLLWELYQERNKEYTRLRPLVFIGRGAGEIIIQKTLVAARLDVRYWDMFSRTVGVVFFDTPHLSGDDAAALTELSDAFVRIPDLLVLGDTNLCPNCDPDTLSGSIVAYFQASEKEEILGVRFIPKLVEALRMESPKRKCLHKDHHEVLQLLRPHNMRQEHVPAPATPGTCSWIEEKAVFKEWREWNSENRLLWICGEMGCGKTYLSRHIKQILEDPKGTQAQLGSRGETVAYCCLQNLMEAYRTPQRIIAWLLYDVINAQPEVADAAKLGTQPFSDFTQYDAWEVWKSVVTEATKHGRCLTFIVDEIDQLRVDDKARDCFLKSLAGEELPDTTRGRVRLLVLSRPQERLETTLGGYGFSRYNITPQDTQPDINKTAKGVLDVIEKYPGGLAIVKEFRAQLEEDADGMYLWARLALDEAVKRVATDKQSAGRLAKGIFRLFDQYLGQFVSASGGGTGKAFPRIVLFWLTHQARPMSEEELRIACAMVERVGDVRQPSWTGEVGENRDFSSYRPCMRQDVLDACGPLVKVGLDGRIGLVHPSLKEYLATPREALPDASLLPHHEYFHCDNKKAHKNISSLCKDYLLQSGLKDCGRRGIPPEEGARLEEVERRTSAYVFLPYAALYWIRHARLAGPPFAGGLEEWNDDKSKQLLSFGDEPQNERPFSWMEVWWVVSR